MPALRTALPLLMRRATSVDAGSSKINVIKVVREITGLGLKEAKEKVDSAPQTIKEAAPEAEANEIKEKLEAAGAKVELK